MAPAPIPRNRGDFHVVIICALEQEAECVHDALDKIWDSKKYGRAFSDDNAYTLGAIGEHNVVLIHMPGMGTDRATAAVTNLKSSFEHIKLALVVGICGGMPHGLQNEEIVLGDVVISEALVRYDFGKQYPQGFQRRSEVSDVLGPPTEKILSLLKRLKTKQARAILQDNLATFLKAIQQKSPELVNPGPVSDILYRSSYAHQHHAPRQCDLCEKGDEICEPATAMKCEELGCDTTMCVTRPALTASSSMQPKIHFGTMASGNTVIKSGYHRDALAKERIIAVEMEGAGPWRHGPTIVIKGVCDYADSHKQKAWQPYAAATAAACTKAFLLEWPPEERQDNSDSNAHFEVPEQRVDVLFGREGELTEIEAYFTRPDKNTDQPRTLVLHAMGGQGKSQIALEYCYRTYARQTHHGVFWVDGSSDLTTTQSLVVIARQICGPESEALADDKTRVRFAIRTLETWKHRWLVVYDNCDDPTTFSGLRKKFLPKGKYPRCGGVSDLTYLVGKGDLLITSRHQGLGELGRLMQIPSLPPRAGVRLLLHRYGTNVSYDEFMTEGLKIVERLGGLALAIDQASAYMQYRLLPLDQLHTFLPLFLAERAKVLTYTKPELWNYAKIQGKDEQETAVNAFTTWEMSFQQLLYNHKYKDEVEHFFTLSAFFGATFIDETLFKFHAEAYRTQKIPLRWMVPFYKASKAIPHTSTTLQRPEIDSSGSGPIQAKHNSAFVRIRKRLRNQIKKNSRPIISPAESSLQQSQAIQFEDTDTDHESWNSDYFWDLIRQAFQMSLLQDISPASGSAGARFLLHPLVRDWLQVRLLMTERQAYTREAINAIVGTIHIYANDNADAQMRTAILVHMNAALVCDAEFSTHEHRLGHQLSSCTDASWFASFYRNHGQHDAGLRLCDIVKTTRTREQGSEHPETLRTISNLASTLGHQGKYSEAEQLHRQVIEAKRRVLGSEHPDTVLSIGNLAVTLSDQGKYNEAEQLERQVADVNRQVSGPEHPNTMTAMNNLALIMAGQGKHSEAEQIYRQVIEAKKRVLGPKHPGTLISMDNLAVTLSDQGKNSEAEHICRQVVEARTRSLGPDHPDTLIGMNNLGLALGNQGKYSEAEQIYRQVTEARQRVLGLEHCDTLTSMKSLAMVLRWQGKYSKAEQI